MSNKTFGEELEEFLDDPNAWEEKMRFATIDDEAHQALFALAVELEAKDVDRYRKVITRCRNGHYHDFASKSATPKMDMHRDLLEVGLTDVDKQMQEGKFDS